eukprot:6202887-Pleurochrysis_carterae.AAC.2
MIWVLDQALSTSRGRAGTDRETTHLKIAWPAPFPTVSVTSGATDTSACVRECPMSSQGIPGPFMASWQADYHAFGCMRTRFFLILWSLVTGVQLVVCTTRKLPIWPSAWSICDYSFRPTRDRRQNDQSCLQPSA